jgi:hypothetical protein
MTVKGWILANLLLYVLGSDGNILVYSVIATRRRIHDLAAEDGGIGFLTAL